MIALAWQTVRARLTSLVGTFIALALGVALLSAMGLTIASTVGAGSGPPEWFTRPAVVVAGTDTVTLVTGSGEDRETDTVGTVESAAVPPGVLAALSTVDSNLVVDYTGYARADGVPGDSVHPWSAAGLHDYAWRSGGAPAAPDQIVLTAPTRYRPGDRITVLTAAGPRDFTVSGVLATDAPPAFYTTDAVARALAGGRATAVALGLPAGPNPIDSTRPDGNAAPNGSAPPGPAPGGPAPDADPAGVADPASVAVLAAKARAATAGQPVRVLTGKHRRDAEPDPDSEKFVVAVSLLGTTSGLAGFVSVFVVAGTFGYAVAARRREFGLLRTAGATARQVRRLVLGEALVVGSAAGVAGGALGTLIAPPFARWLARAGFAPATFTAHFIFWPVAAAFGVGLLVALAGAFLAARRAARVAPIEALRDAAVDHRPMTITRAVAGLLAFGGSVPILVVLDHMHSVDAMALILVVALLLIIGFAAFAPLIIPPLVALLFAPVARSRGAVVLLARHGARNAVRRTASTAAPILVTIGVAGATLSGTATLNTTLDEASRHRIIAPVMATGDLADPTITALAAAPGVTAAVPVTDTTVYVPTSDDIDDWPARYANGPDLAAVLDIPLAAGSLSDLTGTDTVAVPTGKGRVGQRVRLWLADSTPVDLRVVAVFANQIDLADTMLLPWQLRTGHTARPLADEVYLQLTPAADRSALATIAASGGGGLAATDDYLSAATAEQARENNLALVAVLGMALVYTFIAIANTLVMATGDRVRELATLRLAGATRAQVLRMVAVEAVLVAAIGTLLAGLVTAVTVAGLRAGLAGISPVVRVVLPWLPICGITLACLGVAMLASVLPAALVLRRRPVELAGMRE